MQNIFKFCLYWSLRNSWKEQDNFCLIIYCKVYFVSFNVNFVTCSCVSNRVVEFEVLIRVMFNNKVILMSLYISAYITWKHLSNIHYYVKTFYQNIKYWKNILFQERKLVQTIDFNLSNYSYLTFVSGERN